MFGFSQRGKRLSIRTPAKYVVRESFKRTRALTKLINVSKRAKKNEKINTRQPIYVILKFKVIDFYSAVHCQLEILSPLSIFSVYKD